MNLQRKFVRYTGVNYYKTRKRLAYHPSDKQFIEPIKIEFEPRTINNDSSENITDYKEEERSGQIQTYNITRKITKLAVYAAIAATLAIIIVAIGGNISIKDKEGDLQNWVAIIIEVSIAVFISLAILIYSSSNQKKISALSENIITGHKTRSFAIILDNLNSCKQFLFIISERARSKPAVHKVGFLIHEISVFSQVLTNSFDYITRETEFLKSYIPVVLYSDIKEVEQRIRALTKTEGILVPLVSESSNTWFTLKEEAFSKLEKLVVKIKDQISNKS